MAALRVPFLVGLKRLRTSKLISISVLVQVCGRTYRKQAQHDDPLEQSLAADECEPWQDEPGCRMDEQLVDLDEEDSLEQLYKN